MVANCQANVEICGSYKGLISMSRLTVILCAKPEIRGSANVGSGRTAGCQSNLVLERIRFSNPCALRTATPVQDALQDPGTRFPSFERQDILVRVHLIRNSFKCSTPSLTRNPIYLTLQILERQLRSSQSKHALHRNAISGHNFREITF